MNNCSLSECYNKFYAIKYCAKHYKKYKKYGSPETVMLVRHGKSGSPEHQAWKHINQRCYNAKVQHYQHYGGRGIKVCDRWRGINGFINFYEDMGDKPTPKYSIDRINNDGDYEPSNCRWSTQKEQVANQRELRSTNSSGHRNISLNSRLNKWVVQVTHNTDKIYLGVFKSLTEAITARDNFNKSHRREKV